MPTRALTRAALAALSSLSFLFPLSARADTPLIVSGPYTLTQSLLDADADYLGWAAGRALSPDERRRLAALETGRFRRDPAWTIKVLDGEQKTLPSFKTFSAPVQDGLRRTVLADIPDLRNNHLTPDEARQMRLIAAGLPAPDAPAPERMSQATPRPEAAAPARPADAPEGGEVRLPLRSGKYTLTQAQVDTDLAVARIAAARPLTAGERRQVTTINAAQFRRDPAGTLKVLRREATDLKNLSRYDGVRLAAWRKANIVSCSFHADPTLTSEESGALLAIYTRANPVIGTDRAARAVITEHDIDAWVAATRFIAAQAHVPAPGPGYRPSLVHLAQEPSTRLGPKLEDDIANMERNWAALRLVWTHLGAAQRAQMMGRYLAKVRAAGAQGDSATLASVVALQSGVDAFADYPDALDPRLALMKRIMLQRYSRFQGNMMDYNIQKMMLGNVNNARIINGQGIDLSDPKNHIPLPVP